MSTPVPDPTLLTTEALNREITGLEKYILERIDGLDTKITGHFLIDDERFSQIHSDLTGAERARQEQKLDMATSLAAALQAQKDLTQLQEIANQKAIDKTERATAEQLKAMSEGNRTAVAGLHSKIDDLKDRVARIENRKEGATDVKNDSREAFASLRGSAAVVVGVASLAVAYVALHHTAQPTTQTVPTVVTVPGPTVTVTTP